MVLSIFDLNFFKNCMVANLVDTFMVKKFLKFLPSNICVTKKTIHMSTLTQKNPKCQKQGVLKKKISLLLQALTQIFMHLGLQSRWLQKQMVQRIWYIFIFQEAIDSTLGLIYKNSNFDEISRFPPSKFWSISWQPCIVPKYDKPEIFSHNPGLIITLKKIILSLLWMQKSEFLTVLSTFWP